MEDGHLGKCKSCTRSDSEKRRLEKSSSNPEWADSEKERQRQKAAKARAVKRPMILAHQAVKRAIGDKTLIPQPCEVCQNQKTEAHHDSYLPEDRLNVRWLCRHHHNLHHMAERAAAKAAK